MDTSILIARLIGPVLLVAAITMLADPKDLREMARGFLQDRALIYVSGVLAMLGGLAIVNSHNVWVADWPVVITVLGWVMILGGVVRMGFPGVVKSIGGAMVGNTALLRVSGALWALIGAYLTYRGYF